MRLLLCQMWDDETLRCRERAAFARAAGLREEDVFPIPAIASAFGTLANASALLIGGSDRIPSSDVERCRQLMSFVQEARVRRVPIFASGAGAAVVARAFGGECASDVHRHGPAEIRVSDDAWTDTLFVDHPDSFVAHRAEGESVTKLPSGAVALASSSDREIEAFVLPTAKIWATLFHPEWRNEDAAVFAPAFAGAVPSEGLIETPDAERLFRKFIDRIASGHNSRCNLVAAASSVR